jgi:small-conductance mechanosensitive channel
MVVSLQSDLNKVENVCLNVAKEVLKDVEGGDGESQPSVRFGSFTDNGIKCSVNMTIEEFSSQYLLRHEFIKRIIPAFEKEGIVIPYPVREVLMKNIPKQ